MWLAPSGYISILVRMNFTILDSSLKALISISSIASGRKLYEFLPPFFLAQAVASLAKDLSPP